MAGRESGLSDMRKAVGPTQDQAHLLHSGPSLVTPSVWERGTSCKPECFLEVKRITRSTDGAAYAFHAPPAHDEGRVERHSVGAPGGGARGRLGRRFRPHCHCCEGGGQLRLEEVLLDTAGAESGENTEDLLLHWKTQSPA